jgi:hypothetical protein
VIEDLGVQMTLHSTLNSYLDNLLWLLTGNFGRLGTNNPPILFAPLISFSHHGPEARSLQPRGRSAHHLRSGPLQRGGRGDPHRASAPLPSHARRDLQPRALAGRLQADAGGPAGSRPSRPALAKVAPVLLYRTLGPTLPGGAAVAASLWAQAVKVAMAHPEAVRRAGVEGDGVELGDRLFDTILANPSGVVFTVDEPGDGWDRLGTPDKKIHLALPDLLGEIAGLGSGPVARLEFPFVLSAGERRAFTANTIFRDPSLAQARRRWGAAHQPQGRRRPRPVRRLPGEGHDKAGIGGGGRRDHRHPPAWSRLAAQRRRRVLAALIRRQEGRRSRVTAPPSSLDGGPAPGLAVVCGPGGPHILLASVDLTSIAADA